jgi:hypothetical protein
MDSFLFMVQHISEGKVIPGWQKTGIPFPRFWYHVIRNIPKLSIEDVYELVSFINTDLVNKRS